MYLQDARRPESTGPEACEQGLDTRNIFGSQTLTLDVGNVTQGPENEGLAIKLEPNQQGVVQMHFINTGNAPILREGWANLVYVDPATVTQLGDPIFFLGGLSMNVAPGTTQVIKGKAIAPADGLRLVAATGHFHAHTTRFSAWKTIGGQRELLMEDFDWHEPTLVHFDSVTTEFRAERSRQESRRLQRHRGPERRRRDRLGVRSRQRRRGGAQIRQRGLHGGDVQHVRLVRADDRHRLARCQLTFHSLP